jgi:ribosomal protein S18 acetylase RimI-like enzyme
MQNPINFKLRPSNIDDAPLFYSVIDQTMRNFILAAWGRWDEARVQSEALADSISPNSQIIQIGNLAVGVLMVERFPTHIQLVQIYLLPEYQRLGIGTVLLKNLMAEAQQSQIPVRLKVMIINPAKLFYEKIGFIVTAETPEFFSMETIST